MTTTTEIRHSGLDPSDESVHLDYPRDDTAPWKENWGFIGIDPENNIVLMFHISLERNNKRARFSTFHNKGDEKYYNQTYIAIDENFTRLENDRVKVDFIRPFEEIRITDKGNGYEVDVTFTKRFDAYDYAGHRKDKTPTGKNRSMNVRHYEQALHVNGTFVIDGETATVKGLGYRDHTWGYREDAQLNGWNWLWAHFPRSLVHVSQMRLVDRTMTVGYVTGPEGTVRIKKFETVYIEKDKNDSPIASKYILTDQAGKTYTMSAKCFSMVNVPWPDPALSLNGKGQRLMLFENISDFFCEETGETGVGSDEHAILFDFDEENTR